MPGRQVLRRPYAMALSLYRHLPRFLRLWIIRRVAPGHTVGALALIEHDGSLLVLKQRHRRGWTFPGGLLNRGEDAATAVVREVAEETGLRVEVGQPFSTVVEPGSRRVDVLFWVRVDERFPVRTAGEEALESGWVPTAELIEPGATDDPTRTAVGELLRFHRDTADAGAHRGRLLGA
ncbi:NUDIX hydrolase [Kineosporia sp. J2-2]|uniref:NUDIX hydrolase n=1 Tax=Kineosporia corallincola TaxID=2835133 RepID=A0ABS5TA23_9ACTN|nr:NUDIX hydrolase [Kineosporia corallincola]MBT0767915.1 NUDIX hydrolase [Kineosporia corallincola]